MVDEDVEEGARDLLELNDDGGGSFSVPRKRGRGKVEPRNVTIDFRCV